MLKAVVDEDATGRTCIQFGLLEMIGLQKMARALQVNNCPIWLSRFKATLPVGLKYLLS